MLSRRGSEASVGALPEAYTPTPRIHGSVYPKRMVNSKFKGYYMEIMVEKGFFGIFFNVIINTMAIGVALIGGGIWAKEEHAVCTGRHRR